MRGKGSSSAREGITMNLFLRMNGPIAAMARTIGRAGWTAIVLSVLIGGGRTWAQPLGAGTVVAWGLDQYGETSVPAGLTGVVAVAAGYVHTAALKSDGTVVAWGRNDYGQASVPAGLTGVMAVAAGGYHTAAVVLRSDTTAPAATP